MNLIQIVIGLPPLIDGIGDYAMQLARQLREMHGIHTSFIVCDRNWSGGAVEGFSTTQIAEATTKALLQAIEECQRKQNMGDTPILVQFSPYGYAKRGCPYWFVEALEQLERNRPGTINVAFHELDVHSTRPWSSAFWVPPLQRSLIRRVARIANFQYTNTEVHRGKLEDWGVGRVNLIPNFSTLGEPLINPPFEQRRRDIVVFGRGIQRKWTYERGREALELVCRWIGAERVVDIGPPFSGGTYSEIGGVPIHSCGQLETDQISNWMAKSLATFSFYPVPYLLKSTIYAVSCAHGAIPFILDDQLKPHSCPGLNPGEDFVALPLSGTAPSPISLETLSDTVFKNYQERASRVAATKIAKVLAYSK